MQIDTVMIHVTIYVIIAFSVDVSYDPHQEIERNYNQHVEHSQRYVYFCVFIRFGVSAIERSKYKEILINYQDLVEQ